MAVTDIFTGQSVRVHHTIGDITEEARQYSLLNDLNTLLTEPDLSKIAGQTVASTMLNYIENTQMDLHTITGVSAAFVKGECAFAIEQIDQMIAQLQERKKHYVAVTDDIRSFILTEMENNGIASLTYTYHGATMTIAIINPAPATNIAKEPDQNAVKKYPSFVVSKLAWDKKMIKKALADQENAFHLFAKDYDCRVESTPTIKITVGAEQL